MTRIIGTACLIFCGFSTMVCAQNFELGLPFIKYYSTHTYNGGIQNWSIAQNKYGLVYVANNFGVLEFDGSTWKIYTLINGSKVRHISIGHDGKIYVGSQGDFGYLFPDSCGKLTYNSLADSLPDKYRNFDEAWRVFQDHDRLIFCTFRQIFIYDNKGDVTVINPEHAPENFFYTGHKLYVNQFAAGLSYLDGDTLKRVSGCDQLKGMTVTGVINLSNNKLWIATRHNGIYIYNGTSLDRWNQKNDSTFKKAAINCAIRLRNGNYALGTQNSGLFIVSQSGDILLHLSKTKGLNNRTVLSLFEDAQRNLWLGHNNGITTIELDMPFTYINEQVGLPGTGYDGFLDNSRLYLATNNGLYVKHLNSGHTQKYTFVKNTEGQVYSINKLKDKILLGHHEGAFRVTQNGARQLSDIGGAWTFLRLKDRPEYIIQGSYKGLLLYKEIDDKLVFQHKIKGFTESSRVMEQDKNGAIWMTHGYKGVFKLTLNEALDSVSVSYFGKESGLPSNVLINVFRIRNRLVFTTENQIYRFNETTDRFEVDEFFKDFFRNDPVIALAEDPFQNIYYLTQNEIGVLTKDATGEYHKKTSIFNKLKDMLNDDLQDISILNANQILYAAKEGFILYTAGKADITAHSVRTLIRSVRLTGSTGSEIFSGYFLKDGKITIEQPENAIIEIPYRQNSIQIAFSAPFIDGLEKTVYQYWLENSETGWSDWSARKDKEYTNLHEGTYIFHVRAKNIYGTVSKPTTYTFIVLPPWYRTQIAFIFYATFIVALLFVSYYLMDKKHKRVWQQLTLKQAKELHKKETEIESITKKSEEEIEQLKNEKLQVEIDNKNKELATSTMHLINKNGFIANLKGNLSSISKRSRNQDVKNELKKIIGHIDKNISQDDDWEHFAFHFDQVHGDFTNRFKDCYPDLSPQDIKLSAYLRMNLSTKEMAHLLHISVRGVEIARYRLRKKLKLERTVNLQEFILKF